MTEAEWLACTDPWKMLEFLHGKASDRKLRFFTRACLWRAWHQLDAWTRNLVEVSEQFDDGSMTKETLTVARVLHRDVMQMNLPNPVLRICARIMDQLVWGAAWNAVSEIRSAIRANAFQANASTESTGQTTLIREVFGNPCRPTSLDPAWLTWHGGTIRKLALSAYEDRELPSGHLDTHHLAVLADALEDAGCTDPDLLGHCRGPGPHVRGCWVIDLLLGRK